MRDEVQYEAVMSIIRCDACKEQPGLLVEWYMNTALELAKDLGWQLSDEVDLCPKCRTDADVILNAPVLVLVAPENPS